MSTTFGVKIKSEVIEIAFRSGKIIKWLNPLGELLPDNTPVIPIDNSAQGIETIGDIKNAIEPEYPLSFAEAMGALTQGKRVQSEAWYNKEYTIELLGTNFFSVIGKEYVNLNYESIIAKWRIIED